LELLKRLLSSKPPPAHRTWQRLPLKMPRYKPNMVKQRSSKRQNAPENR
jgi:hypothetical protein